MRYSRKHHGFTLIELMIVIAIIAILASVMIPNFIHARGMAQLTACKGNLKTIATGLESYSVDNAGHYPSSIAKLTPNYLKVIPKCPSANTDNYSSSYVVGIMPDSYDFFCQGANHAPIGLGANYPKWDSKAGLIER